MASSVRSRAKKEPSPELEVHRGFVGNRHGLVSGLGQGVVRDMVRAWSGIWSGVFLVVRKSIKRWSMILGFGKSRRSK